ncbi:hypothetical protein FGO68_gene12858 [Halteria grandinella]|uniref:Oxysterol-binding protein n=1 Tax=Halteria grandinella TaxID=5974 RepID=A0A8J8T175_HALGN|nr:hypothetical protein FGO68_gene12858 [Halteria grandinella]
MCSQEGPILETIDKDPEERTQLPFLRGHDQQNLSIWQIIKDSIGKDLWKITVPVVFNEPLSVLQKCAGVTEYIDILDQAIAEHDEMKRFALVTLHFATQYTNVEKSGLFKPFNPLLGETYEYLKPGKYKFLAEQVSHHPPVSSFIIIGDQGYVKHSSFQTKTSFGLGTLSFSNIYNEYLDLHKSDEHFEWFPPSLGVHGLITGKPYIDVEGQALLKDLSDPENKFAIVKFHKRGWTSGQDQQVEIDVYQSKNKQPAFRLEGKWSDEILMKDLRTRGSLIEVIWKKRPYPENWQHQYGMTHHNIQLNYLPKDMLTVIPPTDSRLRPDQMAIESGDFELASKEKHRLEEKQRAVRKYMEANGLKHEPKYFERWIPRGTVPDKLGNIQYQYRYNGKYFEQDRKERNWSRLPDLFSDKLQFDQ